MFYLTFFFGVFCVLINKTSKKLLYIFGAILMLLAFFRYGLGTDYFSYQYLYERLSKSIEVEYLYGLDNQEIGFRLMGAFLKGMGIPFQIYISLIAIVQMVFIIKLCKRFSLSPVASLLLFFCFYYFVWTLSGLRQGLTLSIGSYYLLECVDKRKTLKIFIVSILLSLIHTSAVVLIPLYVLSFIHWSKTRLIIFSLVSILIATLPVYSIILKLVWLPGIGRIIPYLELNNSSFISILDFQSIGRIFFLIIAFTFYNSYIEQSNLFKNTINIFIIAVNVYFLLKFSELTAARLSLYGKLLDIIILPNIYFILEQKKVKMVYLLTILFLCIVYFNKEITNMERQARVIKPNNGIITPYVNIFNKDKYEYGHKYFKLVD